MKRTTHDQVTRDLQSIIRSKEDRITKLIKECNETAGELVWSEAKVKEQAGRMEQAEKGLNELRDNVDALLIICNDKLREMYGNLTLSSAFHQADNVLSTAARGIAEMVSVHGK
ncbi:MAG: hypothetical protein IIB57_12825, partial [Planctomycetes bacterium]|nr:hypothetical protein [Planctomycetota bacterium]